MYLMRASVEGVPLSGGPSNGKVYRSATRWPTYLYGNATVMPTPTGDRVIRGCSKTKGCYRARLVANKVVGYDWTESPS